MSNNTARSRQHGFSSLESLLTLTLASLISLTVMFGMAQDLRQQRAIAEKSFSKHAFRSGSLNTLNRNYYKYKMRVNHQN